jgi:translocator protein
LILTTEAQTAIHRLDKENRMGEIASKQQLQISFLRWALVCVPAIVFLGFLSGGLSNSGFGNGWYAALQKPAIQPPWWVFPIGWTIFYVLMGTAVSMILHARGAQGRGLALGLFVVQLVLNLTWSPIFFAAHQVHLAFWLIIAMLAVAIATTFAFAPIRKTAAWLMLPYLLWLSFASILNWQTAQLNPDAETLVVPLVRAEF